MKTLKISIVAATAVCMALSGVVSVAQEKIPELQREGAAGANMTTMSGCVARGTSTGTYTLTSPAKKGEASTDADQQPRTVALGGTEVDFAPHVGHTVSVTGSYVAAMESTGPTGTSGTEKPAPTADLTRPLRTLTIKSLKMIADSCSEAAE
jgi:hypothetical protein